jgi:hypothetical protein
MAVQRMTPAPARSIGGTASVTGVIFETAPASCSLILAGLSLAPWSRDGSAVRDDDDEAALPSQLRLQLARAGRGENVDEGGEACAEDDGGWASKIVKTAALKQFEFGKVVMTDLGLSLVDASSLSVQCPFRRFLRDATEVRVLNVPVEVYITLALAGLNSGVDRVFVKSHFGVNLDAKLIADNGWHRYSSVVSMLLRVVVRVRRNPNLWTRVASRQDLCDVVEELAKLLTGLGAEDRSFGQVDGLSLHLTSGVNSRQRPLSLTWLALM